MSNATSLPESPRKLLRWTDSSELEDVSKEQSGTDDASQGAESESNGAGPVRREDWYATKMVRLKESVINLRKELQGKERDYIRLKNKYNVSKRRQVQLQEDLQKYTEGKLDLDSELEYLRLQLLEKDKEIAKLIENYSRVESNDDDAKPESEDLEEFEIENDFADESVLSKKYLNLHKENRKLLTYMLLSLSICLSLISILARSAFLSTIVVGLWTLGLSCLWLERKQLFRVFKLRYLTKIRDISMENSRLKEKESKFEFKVTELGEELANERREREVVNSKLKSTDGKLCEELSKNEELVKLEKSTFEELQSERVRRRRAEEQLEEVSTQVLLAQEKDELASCGDVCQELRNNLKIERESKEKLSRENERLIKEIVEMNMSQEKARLKQESQQEVGTKMVDKEEDKLSEVSDQVDGKGNEVSVKYINGKTAGNLGQKLITENVIEEEGSKKRASISGQDITSFDSKESESENEKASIDSQTNKESSQTGDVAQMASSESQSTTKDCWLCAWNIPNETSLALLIIIVACLALALKVVLTSNGYMLVVLMAVVVCFTYYQVSRNFEQ
ncbi:uncharacterized protein LOC114518079 [Dendronephthya gigantea]|uniref:uncharacterized protein LOC114518079 n=1 Tax=Dendronephthya gigantea TaxID=151771 RepID=UPI00106B8869|nr:uncharacterized protein LOC114518079 [Dendronephthya gigantea]